MPTKLGLFNQALLELGEPKLQTDQDNVESRRVLDTVWDNRAIQNVLERAYWKFSLRSVALVYDANYTAEFGYRRVFTLPDDYLRTYMMCRDPYYKEPLTPYQLERGLVFSEQDEIYLRYVSRTHGEEMSGWPGAFEQTIVTYLAFRAAPKLVSRRKQEQAEDAYDKQLKAAMNLDVIENPPEIRQVSNWSRARGRHHSRYGRE